MKYVRVENATYESGYKIRISFSDDTEQVIDFGPFLVEKPHPQYNKYRDIDAFKTFSIEMGNVVWGENWDLVFPVEQLHQGRVV